jgi:hypothetical protein
MKFRVNAFAWTVAVSTLVLAAACAPSADLPDTPELRLEKAGVLARMEREGGAYDETLDLGASLALESTSDALTLELERELTAAERERVETIMRSVLAEFLTADVWENALTQVYATQFTPAEIQAAIDFFSSPLGKKILELQATIDAQTGDAVEEVIDSSLEQVIQRIDEELTKAFPEFAGEDS